MVTIAQDPHHGVSRALYRFALEFVGLAITADGENKDLEAFVHEGFEFMKEAMRHPTQAIAAVGESQVLPHFG